jgi:sugar/nucleoside kinase (ribokinase family)
VIVVVGNPLGHRARTGNSVAGPAADVAVIAARAGCSVELVGKIGDDGAGDAAVLALGRAGVGHAALLRDPAHATPVIIEPDVDAVLGSDPIGDIGDPEGIEDAPRTVEPQDAACWPTLDAEDVELALRYLPDVRTIIVADPVPDPVLSVVQQAARYLGARLVIAGGRHDPAPDADLVLSAPDEDRDGGFAGLLGAIAIALERGEDVETAFESARAAVGLSRIEA